YSPENVEKFKFKPESAITQTMLFVKNCTSKADRGATVGADLEWALKELGLEGFPYSASSSDLRLDVATAKMSNLYVFVFFRWLAVDDTANVTGTPRIVHLFHIPLRHKTKTASTKNFVSDLFLNVVKWSSVYLPRIKRLDSSSVNSAYYFSNDVGEASLKYSDVTTTIRLSGMDSTNGWSWETFFNTAYADVHKFTGNSSISVKDPDFVETFIKKIAEPEGLRNAINYVGIYALAYLTPFYGDQVVPDGRLIGASLNAPKVTRRRHQICLRRSEFICPLGIPSLLTQVFGKDDKMSSLANEHMWWDDIFKAVMTKYAKRVTWLKPTERDTVAAWISATEISALIPRNFYTPREKPLNDTICGYDPDTYKKPPVRHFIEAMRAGAKEDRDELKTGIPRLR
ncbi:unnamed protein product, partial [Ixodes hexagonus]